MAKPSNHHASHRPSIYLTNNYYKVSHPVLYFFQEKNSLLTGVTWVERNQCKQDRYSLQIGCASTESSDG